MKAINPVPVRPVKVKSLKGMDSTQVQEQMNLDSWMGLIPLWEEIPEKDTPELDTETVFPEKNLSGEFTDFHQVTVPFPVDEFPLVLGNRTAMETFQYVKFVCSREGWTMEYRNIMAVLNQLEMDLQY